ncbi:leucyl aminopeptidase [bacterium]|nr:leucyl aminopeptidase [bacterium]
MRVEFKNQSYLNEKQEIWVLPFWSKKEKSAGFFKYLEAPLKKQIWELMLRKEISGEEGTVALIYGFGLVKKVLVVGLGEQEKCNADVMRNIAGEVARKVQSLKLKDVAWFGDDLGATKILAEDIMQALVEGTILGSYTFDQYKTDKDKAKKLEKLLLITSKKLKKEIKESARKGQVLAEAVNVARDLVNIPANDLPPQAFVKKAKEMFEQKSKVTLEVIDAKAAAKLGMNVFLGVGQGSKNKSYMLTIAYNGMRDAKLKAPICLVGKGVTFDSGGINLKSAKGVKDLKDMKADMGGAAAVLGAMQAIVELQPQKNVLAIIPLVENMPSGTAQRPGDVVTAMNGKTIEVINTDAEGRLILADALCLAVSKGAKEIIDIATLTGAAVAILGDEAAALLGNNQRMLEKMLKVAKLTGEKLWQLPLWEEYLDYLKSDIADIANLNENRKAGTVTAAKFLQQFVDKTPWLHLDIASVVDYPENKGYKVKGNSGAGVRNLAEYVLR